MKIDLHGYQVAFTDAGNGPPILFIHGYPLSRKLWAPQIDGLAEASWLLAPDLPGFGGSAPVSGPTSMEAYAADLNEFLNALYVEEPVILCGLSMGGYVAFAFYRKYRERVRALILTATRARPDTPEARQNRSQAAEQVRREGVQSIIPGMIAALFAPQTLQQNPELVERVRAIMSSASPEGVIAALRAMAARPDSTSMLAGIRVPTLVVHGEDDSIIPLEEARQMAESIPGAGFETIPGAGHLLNLESPQRFNQVLREFLESL